MTRETDFFKSLYKKRIPGQADKDRIKFSVPIGRAKSPRKVEVYLDAHTLPYQKHIHNRFFSVVWNIFLLFQKNWLLQKAITMSITTLLY